MISAANHQENAKKGVFLFDFALRKGGVL